MHDALGRLLKAGDFVLVTARIVGVSPGSGYCNVTLQSALGRKPDGQKETYCTNTAVVLRDLPGDDNSAALDAIEADDPAALLAAASASA